MSYKIAIVISHPVQHFCPMYASWAKLNGISLKVFFASNLGSAKYFDTNFKKEISWSNLYLDEFSHEFLNGDKTLQSTQELDAENFSELYVANGEKVTLNFSNANAILENENKKVQILVSNGIPLLGIGFLTKFGYKAIIDCKQRTVTLEK